MSLFIETIKIENRKPLNIDWHIKRISKTMYELFNITAGHNNLNKFSPLNLKNLFETMELPAQLHKCIITYSQNEITDIQLLPYTKKETKKFKLIYCDDIEYNYKYADRSLINKLYDMRDDADDIIIVKNRCITDTSIANLVFFDGKNYYTPDAPLLCGTCRERLIEQNKIKICRITVNALIKFKTFSPVNAMCNDFAQPIPTENIIY